MKYIKFYPVTISASSEGSIGDKMLTGRVVGVLERSTRDYVVSMPEEEVESRSSKVSALVNIPWLMTILSTLRMYFPLQ
jgi:hypothetical protein